MGNGVVVDASPRKGSAIMVAVYGSVKVRVISSNDYVELTVLESLKEKRLIDGVTPRSLGENLVNVFTVIKAGEQRREATSCHCKRVKREKASSHLASLLSHTSHFGEARVSLTKAFDVSSNRIISVCLMGFVSEKAIMQVKRVPNCLLVINKLEISLI